MAVSRFKVAMLCYSELFGSDGFGTSEGVRCDVRREDPGVTEEGRADARPLAEQTGSSKSYVWELENKNPPRPSAEKIDRIAKALGVTADYLMDSEADLATRRGRGVLPQVQGPRSLGEGTDPSHYGNV